MNLANVFTRLLALTPIPVQVGFNRAWKPYGFRNVFGFQLKVTDKQQTRAIKAYYANTFGLATVGGKLIGFPKLASPRQAYLLNLLVKPEAAAKVKKQVRFALPESVPAAPKGKFVEDLD